MLHMAHDAAIMAIELNITPELPPGANGLLKIVNWVLWIAIVGCTVAVIVSGVKFAWEKWSRGESDAIKMLVGSLVGAVIAISSTTIINAVGV